MRTVTYISGTRADFGLMERTLQAIHNSPDLAVSVLVTGMHLDRKFGMTVEAIRQSGLPIAAEVPVQLDPATGATMARNIGAMIPAFVDYLERARPDVVLLLGDRGEMLAGAIAAIHLNIPVAHIHGGERSGTVDEPVRHAVSKLSHLHFVATQGARDRLIRMGEAAQNIHVTGAPGLDGLTDRPQPSKTEMMSRYGLDSSKPFALFMYHPVLQDADDAAAHTALLICELQRADAAILALAPNADAGSEAVSAVLQRQPPSATFALRTHLPRADFIAAMAAADLMIGNSSAGIIEAASFGTPVLNVGPRQNLRERNANVTDVACTPSDVRNAIASVLDRGRYPCENVYGDGHAAERITALLADVPLDKALLMKVNGY